MNSRKLPMSLAMMHALVALCVFSIALVSPVRSGLLPIIVFVVDIPASFLIIQIHELTGYGYAVLIDAVAFLVLGSAWWYGIGMFFAMLIKRFHTDKTVS
jgi:hypothetical protein